MKAFFTRLHIGGSKDKDASKSHKQWPPPEQPRTATSPPAFTAFKPLPELVHSSFASQLTPRPPPPLEPTPSSSSSHQSTPSPRSAELPTAPLVVTNATPTPTPPEPEPPGQISRKPTVASNGTSSTASDVQKKVAFISPPPTPGPTMFERDLPETPQPEPVPVPVPVPAPAPTSAPTKTSVSRFQATHGEKPRTPLVAATSSKVDVSSSRTAIRATTTRATSPYLQKDVVSAQSLRSATPYSTMSAQTSGSRILAAASWSELTEEDLVSNIGPRERTRQEVLFEIISSEERYVQELTKMKETFIDPLLHPFSTTPSIPSPSSPIPMVDYDYYRSDSPGGLAESMEDLPPIAARFMSPTPSLGHPSGSSSARKNTETPNIDDSMTEDEDDDATRPYSSRRSAVSREASKHSHPRSPYRSTATRTSTRGGTTVPFPSRSHHSLPYPRDQAAASTQSLGKQSTIVEHRERKHSETTPQKAGVLRKFRKSQTAATSILGDSAIPPHQLPEDLRICLEVIDGGVFDGHRRLSEALKRRYDDQYPLVRSLADVFVSNSDIFHGYATYVLHLERALEHVDAALSNATTKKPKKQDVGDWQKVCKVLQNLEELAAEKGETGLAITLSKPFQRLLKYPLLFQNLLYHTDPSTYEYESTLLMVAEVETIVRSIEDEKIQKEERDKTRDVFARIEGLDKVRQLAQPKPSRVLVEERSCNTGGPMNGPSKLAPSSPPPVINAKGVRGKSSFKRLSDVLGSGGIGGKKDLWYVVFNDVVLQCQRTGTTSVPIAHTTTNRVNSLPDMGGKSKYATTGRRNSYTKPRNLYKFIKIETWTIGDVVQPREGVVSMEDVVRSRHQSVNQQPRIIPLPDDDEDDNNDSDDSDKKSKMSFSYWGADKITVQKPVVKGRPGASARRSTPLASYGRESSANAKFGTRLVSADHHPSVHRPASRRTMNTPVSRRPGAPPTEETPNYAKATITRSAWDSSTKPAASTGAAIAQSNGQRKRNTSQVSASTKATVTPAAPQKIASPVPSEDSGVGLGLYQKVLANDPSLSN